MNKSLPLVPLIFSEKILQGAIGFMSKFAHAGLGSSRNFQPTNVTLSRASKTVIEWMSSSNRRLKLRHVTPFASSSGPLAPQNLTFGEKSACIVSHTDTAPTITPKKVKKLGIKFIKCSVKSFSSISTPFKVISCLDFQCTEKGVDTHHHECGIYQKGVL